MHGDTLHSVSLRHLDHGFRDGGGQAFRQRPGNRVNGITLNGQQLRATVVCQQQRACSCKANGWK
jgi:3-methylcrotonyl-CoA carboxylase alpha subunit